MTTEEYLEKIEDLEKEKSLQRTEKRETPQKDSLPIAKLGVYIHLLPIILELLEIIDKAKKNNHAKLWLMLYETSVNSMTDLIVGYNKYHAEDKVSAYNKVRENMSRAQTLIIILTHLKQFEEELEERYCTQLEECIRATSSLIRKMEEKMR